MIIQDGVFTPGIRTNRIITQIANIQNLSVTNCNIGILYVNNIEVSGNININGNLTVQNDLIVQANSYFNEVDVSGNLTVQANSYFNEVDISGNLTVQGNSYFNEVDISGNLTVQNDLTVQGNSYLNNVDISGNLTLYSTENIDASGNLSTDIIVSIINGFTGTIQNIPNIGQLKIITCIVNTSTVMLICTDPIINTVTFAHGSSLVLMSMGPSGWAILSIYGATTSYTPR